MRLLRCKVSGHFALQNSGWMTLDSRCTMIAAPAGCGKSTLLRALRSINPPACDNVPAPFAAFPQFVTRAGHRRKVLPAKKTAVFTVFVCDDGLRERLAAIDPAYWETDRIEVGRRLDNSRWVTFVEIAASGRWSELEEEIGRFRDLSGGGPAVAELAGLLEQNAALRPADRIKGRLAARLEQSLDRLATRDLSGEQSQQLQKMRSVVRRAARYRQAVKLVEQSLPVMIYLERSSLLSGIIKVTGNGGKGEGPEGGCLICTDLFLLELLGIAGQQFQPDRVEEAGRQLGRRLAAHLPGIRVEVSMSPMADSIAVLAGFDQADPVPLDAVATPLRWGLSCAIIACYFSQCEGREVIFLLDEPDREAARQEKGWLADFLERFSESHQLLIGTTDPHFMPAGGRRYRLAKDESGSTTAVGREDEKAPD